MKHRVFQSLHVTVRRFYYFSFRAIVDDHHIIYWNHTQKNFFLGEMPRLWPRWTQKRMLNTCMLSRLELLLDARLSVPIFKFDSAELEEEPLRFRCWWWWCDSFILAFSITASQSANRRKLLSLFTVSKDDHTDLTKKYVAYVSKLFLNV